VEFLIAFLFTGKKFVVGIFAGINCDSHGLSFLLKTEPVKIPLKKVFIPSEKEFRITGR
jgi:hypothetical protein